MSVVKEKAEERLIEALRHHWEDKTGYRAAHFHCAGLKVDHQSFIIVIRKCVFKFFENEKTDLYQCHDNDIFILARDLTAKRLQAFVDYVARFYPLEPEQILALKTSLSNLYEITVTWGQLRSVCEAKLERKNKILTKKQENLKAKKQVVTKKKEQQITQINLDKDLIATIGARRDQRQKPEIMIVEDDLFTQRMIKNAIGDKHHTSEAKDGMGALLLYLQKAPDILFLDIGLPDISGHMVLEKVLEMDPKAYVVMLSGSGDRSNILKAVEHGARGFVGKPFTKDKLQAYIQKSPHIEKKA